MTNVRSCIICLILVGAATALVVQHRGEARLRAEVERLRQRAGDLQSENESLSNRLVQARSARSPRLPAPFLSPTAATVEPRDAAQRADVFAGFPRLKAKAPCKLTARQLESYLEAKGRNAASLLAAYRTTGDPALLEEATRRFGSDPRVALEAALRQDTSPEQHRQWLDAFKQSDPDNSLPNYLTALACFKAGQTDQAIQELLTASDKPKFEDYALHRAEAEEQAYLAAGYSMAESKAIPALEQALYFSVSDPDDAKAVFPLFGQQTEQLAQTKALCQNLVELAKSYRQSGDSASAQAALQMAATLGQRYGERAGEDGLGRLAGDAAEVLALANMAPDSPYGSDGQTVQDRLKELRQHRAPMKDLYREAAPLLGNLSEQDWAGYSERARIFGEPAALQWVMGKCGSK